MDRADGSINHTRLFEISPKQEMTAPASESTEISGGEKLQHEVQSILQGCDSFTEATEHLVDLVADTNLPELQILEEFVAEHQPLLETLQESTKEVGGGQTLRGWFALKELEGAEGMETIRETGLSIEQFRQQYVDHVQNLCLAMITQLEGQDPDNFSAGTFTASGTVGWDSDIDTVLRVDTATVPISESVQNSARLLFDAIVFQQTGMMPDVAFDTQCYNDHPGRVLETSTMLQPTSTKHRARFAALESKAAALQMKRGSGPEAWEAYKSRRLEAQENEANRLALSEIFADAEALDLAVATQIEEQLLLDAGIPQQKVDALTSEERLSEADQICREDPNAFGLANRAVQCRCLSRVVSDISDIKSQIGQKTELRNRLLESTPQAHLSGTERHSEQIDNLSDEIEELQLQAAELKFFQQSFFEESYYTQGACSTVVFLKEGQDYQRTKEKAQNAARQARIETGAPIHQNIRQALELHKGKMKSFRPPNPMELAGSIEENLAMFEAHFSTQMEQGKNWSKAVTKTSKYSERACYGMRGLAQAAREKIIKSGVVIDGRETRTPQDDSRLMSLETRLRALNIASTELLAAKRKTLPVRVATSHLSRHLGAENPSLSQQQLSDRIEAALQSASNSLYYEDIGRSLHEERFDKIVQQLRRSPSLLQGELSEQVEGTLMAYCGFPKTAMTRITDAKTGKPKTVGQLIVSGRREIIESSGIQHRAYLDAYREDLHQLTEEFLQYAREMDLLPSLSTNAEIPLLAACLDDYFSKGR